MSGSISRGNVHVVCLSMLFSILEVIMKLPAGLSHFVVIAIGLAIAVNVYLFFSGEGTYHVLFLDFDKTKLAQTLGFVSFGLYARWCYEQPILPNQQGIQLFFGVQTGEVWGEGNFLFIPRPFWSIWKQMSVMDFSFTVAAQNRSKEGHMMMVFATGRSRPTNVQLLAKISQQGLEEQVLGLSMSAVGTYIHLNARATLLEYQAYNISDHVKKIFGDNKFYGLDVQVFTTKVVEVSQETMKQFDILARKGDMQTTIRGFKKNFPGISDLELYAMYASIMGINPAVMSYMVHGKGNTNLFVGQGNHQS